MASDREKVTEYDFLYNAAYQVWSPFLQAAERDLRFYLGDQWDYQEKNQLFEQGRNAYVFNRIRRVINLITGYQRKSRLSSVVVPTEEEDQLSADQRTKLLLYILQSSGGYEIISEAFGGALKTGFNLISLWVDYREDLINGDIRFNREPYNAFILDPYFTKKDLSDCGYILRRKYLDLQQAQSLLPDHRKDLERLHKIGWDRDDKFQWIPYQRNPNKQDMMAYNEVWKQKFRNVPVLVDTETGEIMEFDKDEELVKQFAGIYPQLKVIQRPKRYVEMDIIVNGEYLRTERDPYGLDEYPFVPTFAIFEPESDEWSLRMQSLVRPQIDPQREGNRRRSQIIDIIDSQINSGWIAEEDSVINPQSLFQSSQGRVIWKKRGMTPDSLQKVMPAQVPPSLFQIQELFDRDQLDIVGINDASFGETENAQESGVMMQLRQGASLVNIQDVFDNLRYAQKLVSMKVLKLIQAWKPEKIKRIINEEPAPNFFDADAIKYDVTIQEGILTDSQRQMYFRQLVDLKQLGVPVTGEMLARAAPIQGKTQFNAEIAQLEQQQAQAQQEQAAVQNQLLQTQSQMAQAKAISDVALSKERFTRAVANMGLEEERGAQAVQDRSMATLNRVKAIKELESMDDARLFNYLKIIQMIDSISRGQEVSDKAEDIAITEQSEKMNAAFPKVDVQNVQEVPNVQ